VRGRCGQGLGGSLGTAHPWLHLLRAAAMMGSGIGFFMALREIPMAEGYLVYFTAPFLTMAMAALLLGETPPRAVWLWSAVGFLGVLVAMAPGLQTGGPLRAYAYAMLGTASYATVLTINRKLRQEAGVARLILWSALPGALVLAALRLERLGTAGRVGLGRAGGQWRARRHLHHLPGAGLPPRQRGAAGAVGILRPGLGGGAGCGDLGHLADAGHAAGGSHRRRRLHHEPAGAEEALGYVMERWIGPRHRPAVKALGRCGQSRDA
jgi:hypothetical protein